MKKYILLFYLSLFILFPKAQFGQWDVIYNNPDFHLYGIDFLNNDTGFVAGLTADFYSIILRTINGGSSWDTVHWQDSFHPYPLCFSFVNEQLGYSAGENGVIYKTTDGGESWDDFNSPYGVPGMMNIRNFIFITSDIGFARNYRTEDGGYTWNQMEIGTTMDYSFWNDSTGLVASSHGIFTTDNYGVDWIKVDPDQDEQYNSVCMATNLVGYAAKHPDKIYKTIDGGISWYLIDSLFVNEIKQIRFTDENNGYILINNNSMRVLKTTDGGNSWDYVLFGDDISYQMSLPDESTILVPTINGIMYKTTNGGGDPILPRYTEIDWYSKLGYGWADPTPPLLCLNSYSQPYLMDMFKDTLFVDEVPILISSNPQYRNTFILRYNTWGSLNWYTKIENSDNDIRGLSATLDSYNNYYLIYRASESWSTGYTTHLVKYSSEGDSLWTKTFTTDSTLHNIVMKTTAANHIIISGEFSGTIGYENNNIHADNWAVFILELDQDGNFLKLNRIVEAFYPINDNHFDINDEGSLCLSFTTPGPVYINSDTLNPSWYYLLFLDQNLNLLWYNTNFNTLEKKIYNFTFNSNSSLLLRGRDIMNNKSYQIVYQYDEEGNKTDSAYIITTPEYSNGSGLTTTTNSRILTSGKFSDLSILENDTLYGFGRTSSSFIYTLSNDLEFVKSSHISGTGISSLLENQHNSYLVGTINTENIIFANDTIIADGDDYFDYFIAKLNSIITPVSEKASHDKLRVFPNPSTGLFSIVLPEGSSKNGLMEIYSITGQKIYEVWISEHNSTLDLSILNKGVYFVQLSLDRRIYSEKIIIQ